MGVRVFRDDWLERRDVSWRQIFRTGPIILAILLALIVLWNGIYTVRAHEQAVVLRFGKLSHVVGPGLHFKIPLVDEAVKVSVEEHTVRLPYAPETPGPEPRPELTTDSAESLMFTGDLYAALVEWTVQWRVVEPDKYVFSIAAPHIEQTIHAAAQAVMHRLVGDYSIDEILTTKREEVGLQAQKATQKLLDAYDCGIQITGLQMQRVTPPHAVKPAFDRVNESIQQKDTLVSEALKERSKLIPQAEAKRDRLIRDAEGYASRRRAEAQGEISALLAKYREYEKAPDITRRRMYLEAMEEILSTTGQKTILDSDLKSLLPLLRVGEN
jgi:membrane protease subunit HflK